MPSGRCARYRRERHHRSAIDLSVPVTELAVSMTMSPSRLELMRAIFLAFGLDLLHRLEDGRQTERRRSASRRCPAELHLVGVAVDDLTWLIGMPSRSATSCANVVSWP